MVDQSLDRKASEQRVTPLEPGDFGGASGVVLHADDLRNAQRAQVISNKAGSLLVGDWSVQSVAIKDEKASIKIADRAGNEHNIKVDMNPGWENRLKQGIDKLHLVPNG